MNTIQVELNIERESISYRGYDITSGSHGEWHVHLMGEMPVPFTLLKNAIEYVDMRSGGFEKF